MRREAAHASVAVVVHRLADFFRRVHHKRPLANDRFLDRLPIEEQKCGVLQRLDRKRLFLAVRTANSAAPAVSPDPSRTRPFNTNSAVVQPAETENSARAPAVRRTSQTFIGLKVCAGPCVPW